MAWITERRRRSRFEAVALPHLDAGYALARWLTRNDADAADVVQEAFLQAAAHRTGIIGAIRIAKNLKSASIMKLDYLDNEIAHCVLAEVRGKIANAKLPPVFPRLVTFTKRRAREESSEFMLGKLPRANLVSQSTRIDRVSIGDRELLIKREAGETIDPKQMSDELDRAVADVVKRQKDAGIDIGNDGEQQRVAFQTYMAARMSGYGGESKRRVGKDFVEHPDLVATFGRRFVHRAKISNAPQAIADVKYTDTGAHQG